MNYRHHFHAGNFADVFKHALLLGLIHALQRKESAFLLLDTHAGAGEYRLAPDPAAEWHGGIGRLWGEGSGPQSLHPWLKQLCTLVNRDNPTGSPNLGSANPGNPDDLPRRYPGSPRLAQASLRPQDRLLACEIEPEALTGLRHALAEADHGPRTLVHAGDGYQALAAQLPPPEKRGLILIDPPFEASNEFERLEQAARTGLKRFPQGIYALWFPIKQAATVTRLRRDLRELAAHARPQAVEGLWLELELAAPLPNQPLSACGMAILNPPWRFGEEAGMLLQVLVERLGGNAYTCEPL